MENSAKIRMCIYNQDSITGTVEINGQEVSVKRLTLMPGLSVGQKEEALVKEARKLIEQLGK